MRAVLTKADFCRDKKDGEGNIGHISKPSAAVSGENMSVKTVRCRLSYAYGFRRRSEYDKKSGRSYDNEKRRMESLLGDCMKFRRTAEGKNVFISVDTRVSHRNPLYNAWKAKSFTDRDITLHFILLDILAFPEISLSLKEITEKIDGCLAAFENPMIFDESTVRNKLNEYVSEGIIISEIKGKKAFYHRADSVCGPNSDMLDFFSEVSPCGVIGSYMLGKKENAYFAFKHHYITGATDSEIMCELFDAMREKRCARIKTVSRRSGKSSDELVAPLQIFISVQNGRQYLMAYVYRNRRITSFRLDNIILLEIGGVCGEIDELRKKLDGMKAHMWGVSTQGRSGRRKEYVEFSVGYKDDEEYIHDRLEREKRCGKVERIDGNSSRFSADVFDSAELRVTIPIQTTP